jgi:O-antigen/teichoic acid export membrane protein
MSEAAAKEKIKFDGEIIKDAAALGSTLYFSQALYMVRGFIIAHVLGPASYGVWSIFRTVFNSAPFLGFGAQDAMVREVPFSMGKGKEEEAPVIIQTSLSWNLLLTSCISVIAFILSFTPIIREYNAEIRLAGLVFVLNGIHLFMQPKLKSEKKIIQLSKYLLSYAILNFIFGLTFLFFLEIQGLLLGMIISQLLLFAFLISKGYLSLHLSLNGKVLRKLLGIGFPIMIISSLFYLMRNIDKFIVITLLGKKIGGYYALAAFISSVVRYISYSTSSVLLPRAMYAYGKTRNIKDLETYYTMPMTIFAGFVPVVLGLIYINVGAVVNLFLPQYLPAVSAMQILILGLFFTAIWGPPTNLLIALNKQKSFMYITAAVLLVGAVLEIIIIKMGFGMNGAAIATTSMFLIASLTANSLALLLLKDNARQIWKSFGMIYLPFIYSTLGLLALNLINTSGQPFVNSAIKSLIYFLYCIPIFVYTERKSGIAGRVFIAAKKFRKKRKE